MRLTAGKGSESREELRARASHQHVRRRLRLETREIAPRLGLRHRALLRLPLRRPRRLRTVPSRWRFVEGLGERCLQPPSLRAACSAASSRAREAAARSSASARRTATARSAAPRASASLPASASASE